MSIKNILIKTWDSFNRVCDFLKPIGDLFIRFWVAKAFFLSGLGKIDSWNTTKMLFEFEYHVPLLSSFSAALLATSIELGVSFLLLIGLGGRLPALILFLFNLMAISFYPFLWTQAGYIILKDHICLGLLLLILLLHGPGKLSVDRLIIKYFQKNKINQI